jgi:hypothetical protein
MVKRRTAALLVLITMGGVVACDDTSGGSDLILSKSGGCGDVLFWGFAHDAKTAITIHTEVGQRSASHPTTVNFSVPSTKVSVQILDLDNPNFCSDLGPPPPQQAAGRKPVNGRGTITVGPAVDPTRACGQVEGELTLTGLQAADGTTFAPIRISSTDVGCYAG